MRIPLGIEWHQKHFASDETDDFWLPFVGSRGWAVLGYDWSYHKNPPELAAIRQYNIGVFYLWGAQEQTWPRICSFARAYDRILLAISRTPRPFIYEVTRSGRLLRKPLN